MGNPDLLRITGCTPEQEQCLRDICSWPEVPDLKYSIHVNCGPNYPAQGGRTGFSMADSFIPDPRWVGDTFLHEYGHVWDYHWLTMADRQAIIDLHDMPYQWRNDGPYLDRPVERFGGTFSRILMEGRGYYVNTLYEPIEPPFTDIGDLSQEMQDAIMWMYNEGITKGTTMTTYSPNDFVTRGQMALFIDRAHNN